MFKERSKLKIAMNIAFMVSAAGVATIVHNAPASAETYTAPSSTGNYTVGTDKGDYVGSSTTYGALDLLHLFPLTTQSDANRKITGTAQAQIMKQITSATAGTLDFGKVVPTVTAGTVVVNANGSITNSGGARYIPNSGAHVATLSFSGEPNQGILIDTVPSATLANGANTMTVNFLYPTLPTTIGAAGTATMNYGGTLNVGANQAAGIYTGTYDIYVTYV